MSDNFVNDCETREGRLLWLPPVPDARASAPTFMWRRPPNARRSRGTPARRSTARRPLPARNMTARRRGPDPRLPRRATVPAGRSSSRTNLTMPSTHTRSRCLWLTISVFVGQSKILTVSTHPTSSPVMTAERATDVRVATDDAPHVDWDRETLGRARAKSETDRREQGRLADCRAGRTDFSGRTSGSIVRPARELKNSRHRSLTDRCAPTR